MTGQLVGLIGSEHPRPGAEFVLALAVVEAGVAARYEEEEVVAGPHSERLRNSARLNAERLSGCLDGRGAFLDFYQGQVRGMFREPLANRFEAHSPTR